MTATDVDTDSITATIARQHFAAVINRVNREETRLVVEKSGIPVAAIVPIADLQRLQRLDAERAERRAVLQAFREPFRDVPSDELESQVERALAELRAGRDVVESGR